VLLAVDVGNTNLKLGVFAGGDGALVAHWRLRTDAHRTADEYAALLAFLLERQQLSFADVGGVSLSSTVPALAPILRELVDRYVGPECPFVEVSASANTGITIAIDNPREMGADRIVDALAAARLYRLPAIIIDFGTATTFDTVDAEGRLLGTVLAPGLMTAMDGLFQRAAKLSRIELQPPTEVVGRNTVSALRSGWVYGYVGLVEGLVARIKRELRTNAFVIATGGLAELILAETDVADAHDPLLTLKGLQLFYALNAPAGTPAKP
jgi:type III pantothenate kinase